MKRVCVFCGSSPGARPEYRAAAVELGGMLASRGIGIVYGGAHVGLMGALADAALASGGEVIGVIPEALMAKEVGHTGLSELRVVASMHERKRTMADLAHGFIALPGGLGTLEEMTEILTWAQLGMHGKPCGFLDVAGYFEKLFDFLDHAVTERFLSGANRGLVLSAATPAALLDRMSVWVRPAGDKWLDRREVSKERP